MIKYVVPLAALASLSVVQADVQVDLISQHYLFGNDFASHWYGGGDAPVIVDPHNYVSGGLQGNVVTLDAEAYGTTAIQESGIVFQIDPNGRHATWDVNTHGFTQILDPTWYACWGRWTFTLEDLSKEQSWIQYGLADNSANLVTVTFGSPDLIGNSHQEVALEPGDLYFAYFTLGSGFFTAVGAHIQIEPHFVPETDWTAGLFIGVMGLLGLFAIRRIT
jgi:hypothetical protein